MDNKAPVKDNGDEYTTTESDEEDQIIEAQLDEESKFDDQAEVTDDASDMFGQAPIRKQD